MTRRLMKDLSYWAKIVRGELRLRIAGIMSFTPVEKERAFILVEPQNEEQTELRFKVVFPDSQRAKRINLSDKRISSVQIRDDEHLRGLPDVRASHRTIALMRQLKQTLGVSEAVVCEDSLSVLLTEGANPKDVRRAVVDVLRGTFDWRRHPLVIPKNPLKNQKAA